MARVRIRVDYENNAEAWWDAARASTKVPAPIKGVIFGLTDGVDCTEKQAQRIVAWAESLPGWGDGPEYAPTALSIEQG